VARLWPAAAGVAIGVAIGAGLWMHAPARAPGAVIRSALLPPLGVDMYPDSTGVAISPDGSMIAYLVGGVTRSGTQLWVRALDSTSSRRLDDADDATLPFWSPDSTRIGFFSGGKLKTIAATGGRAAILCDTPAPRGGAWNASGTIVFAPSGAGPLFRVPATGGTPAAVTSLDAARKEVGHRFPTFLPDGEHFLFITLPGKAGRFDVYATSLSDPSRKLVGSYDGAPVYAAPGWLLFGRQGVLNAQRFDSASMTAIGDPIPLVDQPTSILDPTINFTAGPVTSVSNAGTLAYFSASSNNTLATWYDTTGRVTATLDLPPGHYESVKISPDGARAMFGRSTTPSDSTLWLADLHRNAAALFASAKGRNDTPVWSPDGKQVVFVSDREGTQAVYVKTVDESAPERLLARTAFPFNAPNAWAPDGRHIVVTVLNPQAAEDVWLMPASSGEWSRVTDGKARYFGGPVSPDGHWLAFVSDETGRFELYVQPFPGPGRRVQISQQSASTAWWTASGRQLLYLSSDLHTLWRVDVTPGALLGVGTPVQLATFASPILAMDATPGRDRFLALSPQPGGIGSITIVQNWRTAVER
jgi:Tol biopolymer transport system component